MRNIAEERTNKKIKKITSNEKVNQEINDKAMLFYWCTMQGRSYSFTPAKKS